MRALLLAATILIASAASAMPLGEYVAALERVHGFMSSNQLALAKRDAAALAKVEVEWPGGRFHADTSLLGEIARAPRADRPLLARLETTIAELRRTATSEGSRANDKLLQQLAEQQKVAELLPGGDIRTKVNVEAPLLDRIAQSIIESFRWLGEKISQFLKWLFGLFPRRGAQPEPTSGMQWIVTAVTIAIALAIALLAFTVVRRARRREDAAVATSEPIGSARDEDPLSRGATEWERYAAQLAAAGRYREAIRAWYHAVLVTCYSAGVLHFRKGRTNWEYIATLGPSVPWRAELIELTRRFELEWYGHSQSTADALDDCSARARNILEQLRQRGAA
ncbi:MAG TPA: DUF4129 domain-containing protein [Thermoanaerobaculia bacterium]|nr:DUF4129 domain-containing protein [Thermoanaerobaculia bacterium]